MATMQSSLPKTGAMTMLETQRQSVRPLIGAKPVTYHKTDFRASENLTNLKLTAEKMIQEQACVRTDLQIAQTRLQKAEREVHHLESKLQDTNSENAILRVQQQEALKLWQGLESKVSSTKTFCDQLTETLQQLALQVHEAEQAKQTIEEKLAERVRFYEGLKMQIDDLFSKNENAKTTAEKWQNEYLDLKQQQEELSRSLAHEIDKSQKLELEKAEVALHLRVSNEAVQEERATLEVVRRQLEEAQRDLAMKVDELAILHDAHIHLMKIKAEADLQAEDLRNKLASEEDNKGEMKGEIERLTTKVSELDERNVVAADTVRKLLKESEKCNEWAQEERRAKEDACNHLKELNLQYHEVVRMKEESDRQLKEMQEQLLDLNERHDVSEKESTDKLRGLKEEAALIQQRFLGLANEKIELENRAQGMQDRITSLSATVNELEKSKDELTSENLQLKAEIGTANENARQLEALTRKNAEDAQLLVLHENEKSQFRQICLEKDQLIERLMEEQGRIKNEYAEILAQKASAESHSQEVRRQAEAQLETKQMELNKHIKEISERNDQEMIDIRRKYEAETKEAILKQEQKAMSMLETMRKEYESQIAKMREASLLNQKASQEERQNQEREKDRAIAQYKEELNKKNVDLVQQLEKQKSNWAKELDLKIEESQRKHREEMKRVQADKLSQVSQAEERAFKLEQQLNDLNQQLKEEKLKKEQDLKATSKKYEEAVRGVEMGCKLLEENHLQSSLAMQNSFQKELDEMKKKVLFWEMKCRNLDSKDTKAKTVKSRELIQPMYGKQTQTATERGKCESASLPTHSKTVTHHEYEVATSDGRKTITRHKRTKSTVMFKGQSAVSQSDMKRIGSRKSTRLSSQHRKPSRGCIMGDLFGGKSLDPYSDDPYALN